MSPLPAEMREGLELAERAGVLADHYEPPVLIPRVFQGGPDTVLRCGTCGAYVAPTEQETHVDWHAWLTAGYRMLVATLASHMDLVDQAHESKEP